MGDATRNLMVERGEKSVWDKPGISATLGTYDRERWLAAAFGTGLVVMGVRQRGFGGGVVATLGAALAVRAAMGKHDLQVSRTWLDDRLEDRGWRARDVVSRESEQSFPASDAPSWTAATARTESRK